MEWCAFLTPCTSRMAWNVNGYRDRLPSRYGCSPSIGNAISAKCPLHQSRFSVTPDTVNTITALGAILFAPFLPWRISSFAPAQGWKGVSNASKSVRTLFASAWQESKACSQASPAAKWAMFRKLLPGLGERSLEQVSDTDFRSPSAQVANVEIPVA